MPVSIFLCHCEEGNARGGNPSLLRHPERSETESKDLRTEGFPCSNDHA